MDEHIFYDEIQYLGETIRYSVPVSETDTQKVVDLRKELAILEAKREEALKQLENLERILEFDTPIVIIGDGVDSWRAEAQGFTATGTSFLEVAEDIFKQIGK